MKSRSVFKEFKDDQKSFTFFQHIVEDVKAEVGPHSVLIQVRSCAVQNDNHFLISELFVKRPQLRLSAAGSVSGVVTLVGSAVTACQLGDRVVGVLPLDSDSTGCADFCVLSEFDLVKLPDDVEFLTACACIGDGVKAYTALHYLAHVDAGESVLVLDAAHGANYLAVQLALSWGCKIFAVVSSNEEKRRLQALQPPPQLDVLSSTLTSTVMEETGRLGVDVILDNGVRQFTRDTDSALVNEDTSQHTPFKQSLISCLAVGGRWITTEPHLQLDPPNSLQLYLRSASICYLFGQSWNMSSGRQGKWLHIARDVIQRLSQGVLSPHIEQIIQFSDSVSVLNTPKAMLPRAGAGARGECVVVQMSAIIDKSTTAV